MRRPIECRSADDIAALYVACVKRGDHVISVHPNNVGIWDTAPDGPIIWIKRADFDALVRWYTSPQKTRKVKR